MFKKKGYSISNYSFSIVFVILSLLGISCFILYRLQTPGGDNFVLKQLAGGMMGIAAMVVVSLVDYHFICKLFVPLYLASLLLLLICKYVTYSQFHYVYGWSHWGTKRWIKIGGSGVAGSGFEFMPSEITKVVMVIFLAKLFTMLDAKLRTVFGVMISVALVGIPIFLIYDQPDLSTSIVVIASFLCMLFIAGLSYKVFMWGILICGPLLYGLFWYAQQDYQVLLNPYQQKRILSILHPTEYKDLMYQQNNAAAAISSGGMFGKFVVGDTGKRLTDSVPVVESDFIFSAVGEEFGFFGCAIVIAIFVLFVFLSFRIARRAKDRLGYLLASGLAMTIALQAVVNIGVVLSLLPNTGIPLPFLSSGLSSLVTNIATVGIILNIGLQNKDVEIDDRYEFEQGLLDGQT
ncbi:MAG: FtsW/RodA/SpoVE family cell cycle protein [Lachnospiraceae bacterium]|nr:FtsW/RodA/SpoVE family cell cycle protein [Lachnospiraceae bacterium]